MELFYTKDANKDLLTIHEYIARDSKKSATKVLTVVKVLMDHLSTLPYMGKLTDQKDVRCIISGVYPYKIFYRILEDVNEVHILHILHTKMNT